jgi:hypothetical protein
MVESTLVTLESLSVLVSPPGRSFRQLLTSKPNDGATAPRPGAVADQKIGGFSIPRRIASHFGLFPYDHAQAQKAREIAGSNDGRWV